MKIALVYDRITKFGGAERVLLALHEIWPQAPLFTAFYTPKTTPWAKKFRIIPSFLNRLPLVKNHHEWFAWATPFAFETFDFSNFDIVISVTSAEAKGIITPPSTLHICYLLTPTRYLWSHTNYYQQSHSNSPTSLLIKKITSLSITNLRNWDQVAANRPDQYVAISQTVANRAKKYYHRNVDAIIFPPVTPIPKPTQNRPLKYQQPYYLLVSRLVPYKRVDLAIKAFNHLKLRLVIVGKGMQESYLHQIAAKNVTIAGDVNQTILNNLYQHCQALIFPAEEDFGIVTLEAQSAGKPVIAYAIGGAKETVINGKTGILFKTQSVSALIKAVHKLNQTNIKSKDCKNQAKLFLPSKFKSQFRQFVEDSWQKHKQAFQ